MKKFTLYSILTFAIIGIIVPIIVFVILCKEGNGIPFYFVITYAMFIFSAIYLLKLYKVNKDD